MFTQCGIHMITERAIRMRSLGRYVGFKTNFVGLYRNKAFLMNMQSDSEEKRTALDDNGIELNLVYYYTSSVIFVERGDIPYFTVNQEFDILDVIESFNLMTSGPVNRNKKNEKKEKQD